MLLTLNTFGLVSNRAVREIFMKMGFYPVITEACSEP